MHGMISNEIQSVWSCACEKRMLCSVQSNRTQACIAITPAFAAAPMIKTPAPGFYRIMLGDFEVAAVVGVVATKILSGVEVP